MSVCAVCGKKVRNVGGKIIRGASKEWVCKDCLKKANISALKFSMQNISSAQIGDIINGGVLSTNEKLHKEIKKTRKIKRNPVHKKKKTVACRTCGAEISPRAKRCPHCGEMTANEILAQTIIAIVVAPFIVILIYIAISFYINFFYFLR